MSLSQKKDNDQKNIFIEDLKLWIENWYVSTWGA